MFYDVFSRKDILGYIQKYKDDKYVVQWNDGTTSITYVENIESYKNLLKVNLDRQT
jgi:hypothetical protein